MAQIFLLCCFAFSFKFLIYFLEDYWASSCDITDFVERLNVPPVPDKALWLKASLYYNFFDDFCEFES